MKVILFLKAQVLRFFLTCFILFGVIVVSAQTYEWGHKKSTDGLLPAGEEQSASFMEEYDQLEIAYLITSLIRSSAEEGKTNGHQLGLSDEDIAYFQSLDFSLDPEIDDIGIDPYWIPKVAGIMWKEVDNKQHIQQINWASKNLGSAVQFLYPPVYLESIDLSGNGLIVAQIGMRNSDGRDRHLHTVLLQDNPKLTSVTVFEAIRLKNVDLTNCNMMAILDFGRTGLESVEVPTSLLKLYIDLSPLASIDLSGCTQLTQVILQRTGRLSAIDLSKNTLLQELRLGENEIEEIDLSNNPNITILALNGNKLSQLNLNKQRSLTKLYLGYNRFRFSTFPRLVSGALSPYIYSPQDTIIGGTWKCNEEITDLESEYQINDPLGLDEYKNTDYKWYYYAFGERVDLVKTYDYEETSPGVFKFPEVLNQKTLYCDMTNENYPDQGEYYPPMIIVYQIQLDGIVGIEENENKTDIQVYPNPTTGQLRITNCELEIKKVSVFDITGRLILEKDHVHSTAVDIDLSNYADGVYFIKVDEKTVKAVKK